MAIPKKGSRTLVVDDYKYRWAMSPDSGFMVLVVEAEHGAGQRVEAYFDYSEEPITPAIVRTVIFEALRKNWDPESGRRKPLRIDGKSLRPHATS
ncbi:MAG: hypothetical protein AAF750_12385 [Planctomycetota bacterium]